MTAQDFYALPLYFAYGVCSCSDLPLLFHLSRRGSKLDRKIQPLERESPNLEDRRKEKENDPSTVCRLLYPNLEIKPRASNMLVRYYTTWLYPPAVQNMYLYLAICNIYSKASREARMLLHCKLKNLREEKNKHLRNTLLKQMMKTAE